MTQADVVAILKEKLKNNITFIDKVIIVCAGRLEREHAEAICNMIEWLDLNLYPTNVMLVYTKSEYLTNDEKEQNLIGE